MRLLYILIACLFLLAANQKENPPRKIIDVHFHARKFSDFAYPPPPNPITGKIPKWKNDKEVIEMMLATLKNNNVVKVITAGSLTAIQDFQMADPERFIPSLGYPAVGNNPLPDTASFIRNFREKKFLVFGELGLQYVGKTLADAELEPYLAICERLGIPVAVHTGLGAPNTPYNCCPN